MFNWLAPYIKGVAEKGANHLFENTEFYKSMKRAESTMKFMVVLMLFIVALSLAELTLLIYIVLN